MLTLVSREIEDYAVSKSEDTSPLLKDLVEVTRRETSSPQMLTGPIEGRFLKMMVQLSGARRVLEIGMFTGYSALSMAEGLPEDGEIISCDIDSHHISIARRFFSQSRLGDKIRIMEGPALETLGKLSGPFDFIFIDADKPNYPNYYEAVLPLLRTGGVILIDNVLWGGQVLEPSSESAKIIASLNDRIAADERVDRVMLPIRDGIFVLRKR